MAKRDAGDDDNVHYLALGSTEVHSSYPGRLEWTLLDMISGMERQLEVI